MSKIGIGCISDEKYICLLKPFLKSLYTSNPSINVHILLVQCEQYAKELVTLNPNVTITIDNTSTSTVRKHLARHNIPIFDSITNPEMTVNKDGFQGPRWLMSDRACYCSNSRYRVILDMIDRKYDLILFMDVDAIIRKSLDDLFDQIKLHDICIKKEHRRFNDEHEHIRDQYSPPDCIDWHCGIIGVNNNNLCREFFTKVNELTEEDMFNWDADQDYFNLVYKQYENKLSMYNIPDMYKDEHQNNESYVWCGAGLVKYNNEKYITEQKKYS